MSDAIAPPAKFDIAEAAEAVGASLLAGSEAQVLVISRVVRYTCTHAYIYKLACGKALCCCLEEENGEFLKELDSAGAS